ncbi:MAG TPA: ribulokinase [Polyangiaceae bacterium]|nr:ribulokinase [Polyangiaceae bacterium]
MTIVAGVDFGTLSVRVSLVDSRAGMIASAVGEYPLHRRHDDLNFATQSHADHMSALAVASKSALKSAGISGEQVAAIALDTTGSSVVPVGADMEPIDDYYLWCDHRAKGEAQEITELAHRDSLEAINWCGGVYSAEWGWAKLLHWLRHNPDKRAKFASAFEHCDLVAATLSGVTEPAMAKRSICAAGHKWLWHPGFGGLPPEEFLVKLDPVLKGVRAKMIGDYLTSDHIAGYLTPRWAAELGLKAGIPIPVGAFDAHWDAIGAGAKRGDVVNVVGTSTCIIAFADQAKLIPGVCGVVQGSSHPRYTGVEAGLSAVGDVFNAIAARAGTSVADMSKGLEKYHAGQTGLLRFPWDNGDRTVLVNANVGGITIGWKLAHTAQDEMFAAIEGTAFHTRAVLDRMAEYGTPTDRVINGGGIPQNNPLLNQIYADVLGRPVLVPESNVTGIGSAIFAFMAAGVFNTIEDAQAAVCPHHKVFEPRPENRKTYDTLFSLFRRVYFDFGKPGKDSVFGDVLPTLIEIAG